MPIKRYNKSFGGKRGSATKALQAMKAQYGEKKGTAIFYATANKRKPKR
jgi:hypothetical protein